MTYIVIEGLDGTGKTTQIELLKNALVAKFGEERVMVVREPGSTPVAEEIRKLVKGSHGAINTTTEILLMAAARSELLKLIRNAMHEDKIIISDRNFISSYAYQGAGHLMSEEVVKLHSLLMLDADPDYCFILESTPANRMARLTARGSLDQIESRSSSYFERVEYAYGQFGHLGTYINADRSPEEVHADIIERIRF